MQQWATISTDKNEPRHGTTQANPCYNGARQLRRRTWLHTCHTWIGETQCSRGMSKQYENHKYHISRRFIFMGSLLYQRGGNYVQREVWGRFPAPNKNKREFSGGRRSPACYQRSPVRPSKKRCGEPRRCSALMTDRTAY